MSSGPQVIITLGGCDWKAPLVRAHKTLIGLWKYIDRAWIGFRKQYDGKGLKGTLNRTHASFSNSCWGPKTEQRGGGGGKEKKAFVGPGSIQASF